MMSNFYKKYQLLYCIIEQFISQYLHGKSIQKPQKMSQVLVSVRFQGFYLELLISQDSTLKDLVIAMRNNEFIPTTVPDERLRYKKTNNEEVKLDNLVSDIIENQENNVHYLEVEVLEETTSSHTSSKTGSSLSDSEPKKGPDFFQAQTNKILERIVRYLREGNIESLLRAKQNRRIEATMAQLLTSIGQSFHKMQRLNIFYEKSLSKIVSSKSAKQIKAQLQPIINKDSDYLDQGKKKLIRDVSLAKIQFFQLQSSQQQKINSTVTQKSMMEKKNRDQKQEISNLKALITGLKSENIDLQDGRASKESLIRSLEKSLTQKTNKINEMNDKLQQQMQNSKTLQDKIKQNQAQYELERKKMQDKLADDQKKISQFKAQIQKLKQDSLQLPNLKKFLKNSALSSQQAKSKLDDQIPGDINEIMANNEHTLQLEKMIQSSTSKQIQSLTQLMYYNCLQHRDYSLKTKFHQYLNNKESLLAIFRTQNQKIFGAFTQEKLTIQPESYYLPQFEGSAFLFSLIKDNIRSFSIKEDQNSILFDFDYLIFGNQDLMIDFKENKCTSQFPQGKCTPSYSLTSNNGNQDYYRSLISDQGKKTVDILEYRIYEVKFAK